MNELAGFKPSLCKNIPSLELHLGFNLPKSDHKDSVPPVHLFALMEECRLHGLKNGGWFIFANEDHWAYRSNEFTDHYYAAAKNRLINQMEALQKILKEKFGFNPEITSGLEIVHGIWTSKNK